MKYLVRFFYSATGMEGVPDLRYYHTEARSAVEAKNQIADQLAAGDDPVYNYEEEVDWIKSCLSVEEAL